MIRIAVVDDHLLFRKSLATLISTFNNIKVVIEAKNGKEFLNQLQEKIIDVVLLDIQMPEMDGFETCKILNSSYPDLKILIVSQLTTKESIHKIMELGAHGYFTKNSDPDQLEYAINCTYEKGYYFGMELGDVLREIILWQRISGKETETHKKATLSKREIEIILLAAKEFNSGEIADKLNIEIRTVETHRKRLMEKTKSKNFIGVVLFALKNNYISIDEI